MGHTGALSGHTGALSESTAASWLLLAVWHQINCNMPCWLALSEGNVRVQLRRWGAVGHSTALGEFPHGCGGFQ